MQNAKFTLKASLKLLDSQKLAWYYHLKFEFSTFVFMQLTLQ